MLNALDRLFYWAIGND